MDSLKLLTQKILKFQIDIDLKKAFLEKMKKNEKKYPVKK